MKNIKVDIEEFIERHQIDGFVNEIVNTSDLFPAHSNRCFELKLWMKDVSGLLAQAGKQPRHAYLYIYVGRGWTDMDLPDALRHVDDEADHYGAGQWSDFDTWNKQNDDGYFERELGRETAEGFYSYCRECYHSLVSILGSDIYEELTDIVQGA